MGRENTTNVIIIITNHQPHTSPSSLQASTVDCHPSDSAVRYKGRLDGQRTETDAPVGTPFSTIGNLGRRTVLWQSTEVGSLELVSIAESHRCEMQFKFVILYLASPKVPSTDTRTALCPISHDKKGSD